MKKKSKPAAIVTRKTREVEPHHESRKGQKPDLRPRIPDFKYSTKNKTADAYRDRLRVLKKDYGFQTSIKLGAKLTPQRKAAITRMTRKAAGYLNPKNRFQFVKADKKTLANVKRSGNAHKSQITKKGVFVPEPKAAKKTRITIKRSGEIEARTGSRRTSSRTFKAEDVAKDPLIIQREAEKRGAQKVFLTIRGHRQKSTKEGYSPKAFAAYLKRLQQTFAKQAAEGKGAFKNWVQVEFVNFDNKPAPEDEEEREADEHEPEEDERYEDESDEDYPNEEDEDAEDDIE